MAVWARAGAVRSVSPGRREARVAVNAATAARIAASGWLEAESRDGARQRLKVAAVRAAGDAHVVRFAPGVPRESVAALRGAAVVLPVAAAAEDGAWRLRDLAGMAAVDAQGVRLGYISAVYEGRGDGALKIELDSGGAMVVPAIPAVILAVDIVTGTVRLGEVAPYMVSCDAD